MPHRPKLSSSGPNPSRQGSQWPPSRRQPRARTASNAKCDGGPTLGLWPTMETGSACSPVSPSRSRERPLPGEPEGRQCLVLHCVAGVLLRKQGRLPTAAEVASAAAKVRKELLDRAVSSDTALGPVPEELSRAEADLRIYAHDLRHWAHDKDYRCLAAYPLPFFSRYRLLFLRVDSRGHVTSEEIRGLTRLPPREPIVLVIHQGHMRLVYAAPGLVSGAFPHPRVVPGFGWADLLEAAGTPEAWYKPGAVLRCAHCVPIQDARRTGRGFGVLGLRPLFRAHTPTLKAGGPANPSPPPPPSAGATCWCFGSAARAFARGPPHMFGSTSVELAVSLLRPRRAGALGVRRRVLCDPRRPGGCVRLVVRPAISDSVSCARLFRNSALPCHLGQVLFGRPCRS